ncbi:MAG: multiheme c-type cytochrome [Gammaproteobacteria bacterium]|nr:multiheme c-type cytochrome [Gammaproteobacteria bacterium]
MSKLLFVVALLLIAAGCTKPPLETLEPETAPTFVGSQQCASCHQDEYELWQGSHHELAMQVANDTTVLGDFSDVEFEYFETRTSFFRKDGSFMVRTDNAVGEQQDFEITYTFGVEPLQQYLVEFPDGRKQSLPFTWDTRPIDDGGQRWYHLYPDEYVGPGDPLHWTGQYFTWNTACADCHSTNLQLDYDIDSDTFQTTFDEISVGCEACHGPSSLHLEQAEAKQFDDAYGILVDLDDRGASAWIMNVETGTAERSEPNLHKQQPESCGRCHSRRSVLTENYEYGRSLSDTHSVSLLDEPLYYADGRILDEVYVYGSFVQSKMYASGVTCSDCHNPHSGELHAGPNPNDVCAQCHLPMKFETAEHSNVDVGNCVDCHMPATTYMGVDDRRDHSFRIPGAGESASHYGSAIAAGRSANANDQLLAAITKPEYPAIARATLLSLITPPAGKAEMQAINSSFGDTDPLVRIGALRALENMPADIRGKLGSQLLRDPIRGVRAEAALAFMDQRDLLPIEDARAFPSAIDEYRESLQTTISTPDAAVRLAELEARLGDVNLARRFYAHALRLNSEFALAHHAYGLFLVRAQDHEAALAHIRRAAELEPSNIRYVYVYGVAANSLGRSDEALEILKDAWLRFPGDFDIGYALATISRDSGDLKRATVVATTLKSRFPDNPTVDALLQNIAESH